MLRQRDGTEAGQTPSLLGLNRLCDHVILFLGLPPSMGEG